MKFRVHCVDPLLNGQTAVLFYDNQNGVLSDSTHRPIGSPRENLEAYTQASKARGAQSPIVKDNAPRVLKVQLGLSCNFSCSYCLQKSVPHADATSLGYVPSFIQKLRTAIVGEPQNIQLWGGEPLVYLKTLRPLVAELKALYPSSRFTMITNGSLLNQATNEWILTNQIGISISHDGPGQSVRGSDPFDDPVASAAIRDLYWRKKQLNDPVSFGAMVHVENPDRAAISAWFREKIGDPEVLIGEGAVIAVYDEGGLQRSPLHIEEHFALRQISFRNLRHGADANFSLSHHRLAEWTETMLRGRMLDSLSMKCGMDLPDTLTVDLHGDVVTCQNTSSASKAPNGQPHGSGNLDALNLVSIKTATHFAYRSNCNGCPVVQTCKGGCMYLDGNLFDSSCENNYTDHIPYFAIAIEALTGMVPVYIEDEFDQMPTWRKDIFGYGPVDSPTPVASF